MYTQFAAGKKGNLCEQRLWDVSLVLHPSEIWVLVFPSQSCRNTRRGRKTAKEIYSAKNEPRLGNLQPARGV